MAAFLFSSVTLKVRVITITLSPALSLSAWKEIVFLSDKDGR